MKTFNLAMATVFLLGFSAALHAHPTPLAPLASEEGANASTKTRTSGFDAKGRLDLNRATIDELCTLPGIGKKRAQTIVDYRRKRRFTRLTQLLRVKGVGRKTLKRLKPLLRVDAPPKKVRKKAGSKLASGLANRAGTRK